MNNPNPPWSYNQGTNPLPLVPVWTGGGTVFVGCNQPAWSPSNNDGNFLPALMQANACAAGDLGTDPNNGLANAALDDILVHTVDPTNGNPNNGVANFLFTLPAGDSNNYEISGSIWDARLDTSRPQDWQLLVNGVEKASGHLSGGVSRSEAQTFGVYVPLVAGDTVELELYKDPSSTFGNFVGVNLTISAETVTILHNFTGGPDGAYPTVGLTMDVAGNLYGTAMEGGDGFGTVFKLTHRSGGWTFAPLYSFRGGTDGYLPEAPLTYVPTVGLVYGTTSGGGGGPCNPGCGTVFDVTPSPTFPRTPLQPWLDHVLYAFAGGLDAQQPEGPVVFDQYGNIYGTGYDGGANGYGAVFELSPAGGGTYTETVLYSFTGGSDGGFPTGNLVLDTAGNLYGTAAFGITTGNCTSFGDGCGVVFELSPPGSGWTESVIYSFQNGSDGYEPYGLVMNGMGNLYGGATRGGAGGGGTLFELTPSGGNWLLTILYSINGPGGGYGPLTMDSSGNFYGTLEAGGAFEMGTVFKLAPSNGVWNYTDLYDFQGSSDGDNPGGAPILDSSGNLYGTAETGGTDSVGTVWEITPLHN